MTLTSRERVLAAIGHQQPDRVPADIWAEPEVWTLGLRTDDKVCDMVKTVYNGDPEGYARAIEAGHLPVIMAGGPKSGDDRDNKCHILR